MWPRVVQRESLKFKYLTHIVSVAFSSHSLEGGVGRIENARQNSIRRHTAVVRFESTQFVGLRTSKQSATYMVILESMAATMANKMF